MGTERKAITPAMKINAFLWRFTIHCRLCKNLLAPTDRIEWDHVQALIHDGPHDHTNIAPVHKECHFAKSALDHKANCKVKRLANPKPSKHPMKSSGRKMPSWPFQKRGKKA